jgi:uncharacterized membrane protein
MWLNVLAADLCIALTGLIFILAGLTKILKPKPFVEALIRYKILPVSLLSPVAVSLPLVEFVLGVAILRSGKSQTIAGICALLLLTFAVAMAVNLLRGRGNTPCGCGFLGKGTISWSLVSRNVAFAGIAFGGTSGRVKIAGIAVALGLIGWILSRTLVSQPSPAQAPARS